MIEFRGGNLWDAVKECEAAVNCCNTIGVMGKGVALQFKSHYPHMYFDYVRVCRAGLLSPGEIHVWENPNSPPNYIFNLATKDQWDKPSRYTWIEDGLLDLAARVRSYRIKNVLIPALGCGAGRLSWEKVRPMIQTAHDLFWQDRRIVVYNPLDRKSLV